MKSLKQKTISGIKWQAINKVTQKVISAVTFMVLARILEPSTFGLFAMAFIMIDGLSLFKSFGIDSAIIQKKAAPETAKHTAFFLIQGSGLLMFAVCYLVAPFAGMYFRHPEVASVVRALGVLFVISCFGRISSAILIKEMRFRLTSITELVGSIANSICAIAFAMISPTVWSLVGAYLVKQIVMCALWWYFSGYRLKWQFDLKIARELLGYGKFLIGLSVLWFAVGNINGLIIARVLDATSLGFFALAANLAYFMNGHFTQLVSNVMFPAYSSIQDDPESLKRAYLKTIRYVSIMTLPYGLTLLTMAQPLVLTLYGEKWSMIIPLVRILAFTQILTPITLCAGSVFPACGRPQYGYYLALWDFIFKCFLVYFMTLKWGLVGSALANLITFSIFVPFYFILLKRIVDFRFRELLRELKPALACAATMLSSIGILNWIFYYYAKHSQFYPSHRVILLALMLTGLAAYGVSLFLFDRKSSIEIKQMIFRLERA